MVGGGGSVRSPEDWTEGYRRERGTSDGTPTPNFLRLDWRDGPEEIPGRDREPCFGSSTSEIDVLFWSSVLSCPDLRQIRLFVHQFPVIRRPAFLFTRRRRCLRSVVYGCVAETYKFWDCRDDGRTLYSNEHSGRDRPRTPEDGRVRRFLRPCVPTGPRTE